MKLRNYAIVTGGYWAFTVTDGALRMLVLLHFHDLGYSPISLSFLFLLYELLGVATNLVGGYIGARTGLNRTLTVGLALQVCALLLLSAQQPGWTELLSVLWVMSAQALSGIAKDLTKMSSKSAVKLVVDGGTLFRWVAALTGSKNALKGVGFFVGAALLAAFGFDRSLWIMAGALAVCLALVMIGLNEDIGRAKAKPALGSILAKSDAINRLSAARFFLFGARDIWFVVALPVFLDDQLGWSFQATGAFLAAWVIGYGAIQSIAPSVLRPTAYVPDAQRWALILGAATIAMALVISAGPSTTVTTITIIGGLIGFGAIFAINSSLHSYLILAYSTGDDVSMDVGFYYSANAAGRLAGTLLSGVLYLAGGLTAALWGSAAFVAASWLLTRRLPSLPQPEAAPTTVAR